MIDAIKGDLMTVFGQDRLQKVEIEIYASSCLGEQEWIIRRRPQFDGHWI